MVIAPYTFCLRMGGGYAASFLDFDFAKGGVMDNVEADIVKEEVDWGFTFPNFAANLELKLGLPKPLENISCGLALDYNIIAIKNFEFSAQGSTLRSAKQEHITDVHVFSILAFLEYRRPIRVGKSWLAPYIRFGAGINVNIHDNHDLVDIDTASLGIMASVGIEYHLTNRISIFFEPRWHYNKTNMTFTPFNDSTKFRADIELSNLTFLVGVNLYFGMGKSL